MFIYINYAYVNLPAEGRGLNRFNGERKCYLVSDVSYFEELPKDRVASMSYEIIPNYRIEGRSHFEIFYERKSLNKNSAVKYCDFINKRRYSLSIRELDIVKLLSDIDSLYREKVEKKESIMSAAMGITIFSLRNNFNLAKENKKQILEYVACNEKEGGSSKTETCMSGQNATTLIESVEVQCGQYLKRIGF